MCQLYCILVLRQEAALCSSAWLVGCTAQRTTSGFNSPTCKVAKVPLMKSRATSLALVIFCGFSLGFWLYGVGRTMRETVNFNTIASLSGLVLGVALPMVAALPLVIAKKLWFREKVWPVPSWFVAFAFCLLGGSLVSEVWILLDEARFSTEVSKTNSEAAYSRSRAWPNQTCSLVFVPNKGIHSTD